MHQPARSCTSAWPACARASARVGCNMMMSLLSLWAAKARVGSVCVCAICDDGQCPSGHAISKARCHDNIQGTYGHAKAKACHDAKDVRRCFVLLSGTRQQSCFFFYNKSRLAQPIHGNCVIVSSWHSLLKCCQHHHNVRTRHIQHIHVACTAGA
jgi:hypothetical protein